jgi:hypothetical protein
LSNGRILLALRRSPPRCRRRGNRFNPLSVNFD